MAELPWVAPPQARQGMPSGAETALDRSWGPLESPDGQDPVLAREWEGAAEAGPISSQSTVLLGQICRVLSALVLRFKISSELNKSNTCL